MHGKYGQTIGKMVCKVKVLDISETKLSYGQAVLRDIILILILVPFSICIRYQAAFSEAGTKGSSDIPASKFFFMVLFGWIILDIITMLFNDKCRAMHDYIAGSVVVKTSFNSLHANSRTHSESVELTTDFSTIGINRVQPTDDDDAYMGQLEKIAAVENEIEAICLTDELEERGIPYMMQSYHDSAYDGLFQFSLGWGHVEAPVERKDEILEILGAIRQQSSQP